MVSKQYNSICQELRVWKYVRNYAPFLYAVENVKKGKFFECFWNNTPLQCFNIF